MIICSCKFHFNGGGIAIWTQACALFESDPNHRVELKKRFPKGKGS